MKAWNVENIDSIELKESTLDRKPGEVKLKVARFAMSAGDVSYFAGEHGDVTIPGHSAVGFVSEADKDFGMPMGTKVAISPFIEVDDETIEVMGIDRDGFAKDFVCVPADNVFEIPENISDEKLVFADYIAIANKAFNSIKFNKGDHVAIIGAGTLGLILAQLALYYQTIPILIDYDVDRLEMAAHWGIYYTINPTYDNLDQKVQELTGGRMCEFAFYVSSNIPFNTAMRLVKNGGQVIMAGYTNKSANQVDMRMVLKKQLKITGVSNGKGSFSTAINMLANDVIKIDGLVGKRYKFENFDEMFRYVYEYPFQYNKVIVDIQRL